MWKSSHIRIFSQTKITTELLINIRPKTAESVNLKIFLKYDIIRIIVIVLC